MTCIPSPSSLAAAPLEDVTIPPSYQSPTSDAPPPAYFPPSRSPSPHPPVDTSPRGPNHDANSHWARFPSSSPVRSSPHNRISPSPPSETSTRCIRSPSRAPPGYLAGKLNPAPKKGRHRTSRGLQPSFYASKRSDARYSSSQPTPFSLSDSPYRSRAPSPCPPAHSAPSRITLNVGVETELDTDEERRQQYRPSAKNRYNILADESDLLIEERGRYAGMWSYGMWGERYGNGLIGGRTGRGAMAAWGSALALSVTVLVIVVVVLR